MSFRFHVSLEKDTRCGTTDGDSDPGLDSINIYLLLDGYKFYGGVNNPMTIDFTEVDKKFDDICVGPDVEYLRKFIHTAITEAVEKQRKEIIDWIEYNTHNYHGPIDITDLIDKKEILNFLDSMTTEEK